MTIYELKRKHENNHPNSYFFCRNNMRFAGNTLKTMYVSKNKVRVKTYAEDDPIECWLVTAKSYVWGDKTTKPIYLTYYFAADDFRQVIPEE